MLHSVWSHPVAAIKDGERHSRLSRLRDRMQANGVAATFLGPSENLRYFTGLVWHLSERLLGAVVTDEKLTYIVPGFERSRVEALPHLPGDILSWEEEENSVGLVARLVGASGKLSLDDSLPLAFYHAFAEEMGAARLIDGGPILRMLRAIKSPGEIALIQYAMNITLGIHREVRDTITPGIAASEVARFIDQKHRDAGADNGSNFCIVSFGSATSLPHGADGEQILEPGDVILVDTGCRIDGYHSDLTRTYMLDGGDGEFERAWAIEREGQDAVFEAAKLGAPCETLDAAARNAFAQHGLGPDYRLPGLPHRAGHGLGLEIHEAPFIVRGNRTPLAPGMCFSNEPMIVYPGAFGIRLEDHIYMTEDGPHWFTTPAKGPTEV
ncbi:Xaa-Pro dipeptidase [Rhizobium tibeticum]|uniref:M24 family metallopeptidase n=1 Tax=Rhizobium tibeticum TaxID=501024 RepID=UPI002783B44F|nr:Xaa-Pro peptidase family protein [Rhizobium tibeticum]MDP9811192.1 Xaa-Pro dipeptidase [Rhizobium tibeticum]